MRLRPTRCLGSISLILAGLVWAGSAAAVPITFAFTGVVRLVLDPLTSDPFAASVGDLVVGHYTFESTTPNSGDATLGIYFGPGPGDAFVTSINGVTPPSFGISAITVGTSFSGSSTFNVSTSQIFSGESWSTLFQLEDTSGTAITNVALPTTPPNISDFDPFAAFPDPGSRIVLDSNQGGFRIEAEITSLTLPAPPPLPLLLMGCGLLAASRRLRNL